MIVPLLALGGRGMAAVVMTLPPSGLTNTTGTMNGSVNPQGVAASAWFEWGVGSLYETNTAPVSLGSGTNAVIFTAGLTNLVPGWNYHYRVVSSNAAGVTRGQEQRMWTPSVKLLDAPVMTNGLNLPWIEPGVSVTASPVAIAVGGYHEVGLRAGGTVLGWGAYAAPSSLTGLVKVSCGWQHTIAMNTNGNPFAWGGGSINVTYIPASAPENAIDVAAARHNNVLARVGAAPMIWGNSVLTLQGFPADLTNVVAVSGGVNHALALGPDGSVHGAGGGFYGQEIVPPGATNVVAISAGGFHSLALRANGTVVSWGNNDFAQTNVPPGFNQVVAVATGESHSLALRQDGTIVTWGRVTNAPPGLSNVVTIAAGYSRSRAILRDGTVVAWGRPDNGPTNIPSDISVPPYILGISGAVNTGAVGSYTLTYTVTNAIGGVGTASRVVEVAVNGPVRILQQPAPTNVLVGGSASFSVGVTGTEPITYQWLKNGTNIAGATSASLTLTNLAASDDAAYAVVMSNLVGAVTSSNAVLSVLLPVSITSQPSDVTVERLGTATFAVQASGTSPFTYQWRKNSTNVAGATNATLTLFPVTNAAAGAYSVVVSNVVGAVTSSQAMLSVFSTPVLYWDTDGAVPGAGGPAPDGDWSDASWSSDPAGSLVTDAFLDGASAVFAATSNALGTFTVTHAMASLPRPMANLTVQSGHLTLTGDPLDWGSAQRVVDVGSNATLTLACTITNTSGGLWKTGAGTLILAASNTITGDAVMGELAPGSYGIIRFTCNHGLAGPEKRIWQPTTQSTSTSTVELVSSVVVSNIHLESAGHGAPERPHLHSVSGTNVWGGDYRIVNTGGFYPITCTSGRLVFNGNFDNRIGSPRIVEFHGDGDFVLTGGKYESGTRSLSLRMNGTGTWTLNGSFTGIGGVLVTTGRVVINGSAQSIEPSRVGAGALLSGTGSVSYLQVSGLPGTNAVIDPGGGDVGTLSASTLQLSNATYRCDFANGAADRIDVDHFMSQGPWTLEVAGTPPPGSHVIVTVKHPMAGFVTPSVIGAVGTVQVIGTNLVLHVATPWETWQTTTFGTTATNFTVAGPLSDPDADGVPNWLEYAFGSNPAQPGSRLLPTVFRTNGLLSLAVPRNADALDAIYTVEWSSNLLDWTTLSVLTATNPPPSGSTATVSSTNTAGSQPREFLRVNVHAQP